MPVCLRKPKTRRQSSTANAWKKARRSMFNWPNTDLLIVVQYTNRTQDKIETIQYTILYEYNTYSTTQSNTTIPYQIYSDIIKWWHLFFSRSWSSSNLAAGNLWGGPLGPLGRDAKKRRISGAAPLSNSPGQEGETGHDLVSEQSGRMWLTGPCIKMIKKWQSHGQSRIFFTKNQETAM